MKGDNNWGREVGGLTQSLFFGDADTNATCPFCEGIMWSPCKKIGHGLMACEKGHKWRIKKRSL